MQVIQAYHVVSLDMYVGLLTCVLLLSSSSCVEDVVLSLWPAVHKFNGKRSNSNNNSTFFVPFLVWLFHLREGKMFVTKLGMSILLLLFPLNLLLGGPLSGLTLCHGFCIDRL